MTTPDYQQQIKTLVADLDENIVQVNVYDDTMTDIQFINPVTGSVDEVSLFADYGDIPASMLYCPNIGNGLHNGVVCDTIQELYGIILAEEK